MIMTAPSEDQIQDLRLRIGPLYRKYLKSKPLEKLDLRKMLERYVKHYLYLVPQNQKFCRSVTEKVILQSARWIPSFSALKAGSAFEAIEKYAANLINPGPKRKKLKTIEKDGTFYKLQIKSCLSGAEELFHLMGYVPTGQETLEFSGEVDQDRVLVIARDCFLAYMECQIVFGIVQRVSVHFPCSSEDALDFRLENIGTTQQAFCALIDIKSQRHHQINNYCEYCEQQSLGSKVSRNEIGVRCMFDHNSIKIAAVTVNPLIECPVCLEEPKDTPIYQCSRGHVICKDCYPKLALCPVCKIKLAKITSNQGNVKNAIRNIIAEKILTQKYGEDSSWILLEK